MKTKIFGKKIVNTYEVIGNLKEIEDESGEPKKVFTAKPYIEKNAEIDDWVTIAPDIDEPMLEYVLRYGTIYLSENERVWPDDIRYRADLNETHILVRKTVSERDKNKEEAEARLAELIGDYNEQIIASDEKMTAYCKLHKLNPREADCEEVFELVYPNQIFTIKDGAVYIEPMQKTEPIVEYPSLSKLPFYESMVSNIRNTGTNTATYTTSSNISVR